MNEDNFNMSVRKFLKTLGVTAQREIEKSVRLALAEGKLKGTERVPVRARVVVPGIALEVDVNGELERG